MSRKHRSPLFNDDTWIIVRITGLFATDRRRDDPSLDRGDFVPTCPLDLPTRVTLKVAHRRIWAGLPFIFFLRVLSCLAIVGISARADLDLGSPVSRTPYDPYLEPVFRVFHQFGNGQVDLALVEQLVREGRGFRYYYDKDQPYVTQSPDVTEATKCGDCKAKSLWLASKMNTRNVRFVIGKLSLGSPKSHAWLIWQSPEGWLVLDATNYGKPLDPDRISPRDLVPTYSYSPLCKYAHAITQGARGGKYADHL